MPQRQIDRTDGLGDSQEFRVLHLFLLYEGEQFPDPETILVYSMNHSIQKAFEQIYLSIPKDKRHKDVAGYLNMYFNDREFKRNVVILPKSE